MKILKKKNGNTLIWVLCLFTVVMLISTTIFSMIFVSENTTAVVNNSQQAYFTAKSAVQSTIDYILKNPSKVDYLTHNIGTGSASGMGSYNIVVEYYPDKNDTNSNKLKITATAKYSAVSVAGNVSGATGQNEGIRTVSA